MKKTNENGITLTSLVITTIVLLILASIGIVSGTQNIRSSKYTAFKTELELIQTKVNEVGEKYDKENNEIGESLGVQEKAILEKKEVEEQLKIKAQNNDQKLEQIKNGFRLFSPEKLKEIFGIEGIKRNYLINIPERIVVSAEEFTYKETDYYMLEQMESTLYNVTYNNQISSTGDFTATVTKEINKYKIAITVNHEKYVSKWQVKYRVQGAEDWNETDQLTFTVDKPGTYEIKVVFGDEINLGTKTVKVGI